jgi:hypothetical protein
VFTVPLPSNMCPIFVRVSFCGNVFSDPLPSNGHGADHTSCLLMFRALPRNGSTSRNISMVPVLVDIQFELVQKYGEVPGRSYGI